MPVLSLVYPGAESSGKQIDLSDPVVDWMFRHGEAIEMEDLAARFSATGVSLPEESLPHLDEVSICVPLIAKREMVGLLLFGKQKNDADFVHEDIQFISAVGNQFAVAVISAMLSEELLASRQIESFNRFSTFVMHDLKNSISMLSMLMQNFESNKDDPEFQASTFATIRGAVERMKRLISKLRSREIEEETELESCRPDEIVLALLNKLKLDSLDGINFSLDSRTTKSVRMDQEQLTSIVENLIVNAIEAMPRGGRLAVTVRQDDPQFVSIDVEDSGEGMTAEFINNRLFRPFETTKRKGLGIGLYQSKDTLERLGGQFRIESTVGIGTTFTIELPAEEK